MSRKSVPQTKMPDQELGNAILDYQNAKKQETEIKKVVTELNETIKTELQNRNETEFIVGDVKASITITPKQDVNELQAIEILRKSLTPEQFSAIAEKIRNNFE